MEDNKPTPSGKKSKKKQKEYFDKIETGIARAKPQTKQRPLLMEMMLRHQSSLEIIEAMRNLSVGDVLGKGYPAISGLKKTHGKQRVHHALAALISDTGAYFENSLTEAATIEVATEISLNYYYLSMEDVYILLNRLKRTPLYGKLTPNKILTVADQYARDRLELAATRSVNDHLAKKENRVNYDDSDTEAIRENEAFEQFKAEYHKKTKNEK